ncbi:MAG: PLP-dependent transferase, partial [Dehalococcoidia bacterium]
MGKAKRWGFATRAIHDGEEPNLRDGGYGDVVSPIHLASTFARQLVDEPTSGLEYSRSGNPTRHALERRIASLEGAEHGLAFSSGLGAETTVLLSLKQGDHVVSNDDLYGGTHRLFRVFENFGIKFSSVDASDPRRFEAALTDSTRLVWLESPTNPMLKLC